MWGMAPQLNDATITALAGYFAAQPAAPARGARQIPPCASCHGPHAEGLANFPRLSGQHAPYLFKQLLVIQNVLRTAPVMHGAQ
jgi:cytochrome c553